MNSAAESLTPYQNISTRLARQGPAWLATQRQEAMARFLSLGFPSPRHEEWKYTNLAPIERRCFLPAQAPGSPDLTWIQTKLLADCWHLVLIDGHYARELSRLPKSDQIIVSPLDGALQHQLELVTQGWGQAVDEHHSLIDFNTALFQNGAWIYISPGVQLSQPIQILHVQTQEAAAVTRHLILLGENAQACVIETYLGLSAGLTAHVSEALLGPKSHLEHYKIQQETDRAFHFSGLYVRQEAASQLRQVQFALGSALARSEIHTTLGEESSCLLEGLHWANGHRHLDSHTRIIHTAPAGTSRETYKALAEEAGRSVFQGKIVVQPGAQKTDAAMDNKNLLLSEAAEVDSKPQLEIYADDVQCRHGVSIGQLDEDALFYLGTRGIAPQAARELLIYGFVNASVSTVSVPSLRRFLHRELDLRFQAIDLESTL